MTTDDGYTASPPGHVQADAAHRDPALADLGARAPSSTVKSAGRWAACTCAHARIVSSSAARTRGSSDVEGRGDRARPGPAGASGRTPSNRSARSRSAAAPRVADVREDRARRPRPRARRRAPARGRSASELTARQGATTQVDAGDHDPEPRTDTWARLDHDHPASRALRHSAPPRSPTGHTAPMTHGAHLRRLDPARPVPQARRPRRLRCARARAARGRGRDGQRRGRDPPRPPAASRATWSRWTCRPATRRPRSPDRGRQASWYRGRAASKGSCHDRTARPATWSSSWSSDACHPPP